MRRVAGRCHRNVHDLQRNRQLEWLQCHLCSLQMGPLLPVDLLEHGERAPAMFNGLCRYK